MRFSIGYFQQDEHGRSFSQALQDFGDGIAEVYFPWPGIHTCRSELHGEAVKESLLNDLRTVHKRSIKLNLLLNANCYGGDALSRTLFGQIENAIRTITDEIGTVTSVTTTSLFAADAVRNIAPCAEIRASVNMRLKSFLQMQQLFDLFDGFYLAREMNYQLDDIAVLKQQLEREDKKLFLLANSGCIADCPGQIFHDNMVAHEEQISRTDNVTQFNPYVCWRWYADPANHHRLLSNTWIRPEDLFRYEKLFDVVKLATRIHSHPSRVIHAYMRGRYAGNTLDLTEPSHTSLLYPGMLRNDLMPADWFDKRSACGRNCEQCGYCADVFKMIYQKP